MFLGFADPISWHLIRIRIDENQFGFLDARYCRPLPTGLIYIQRQGHELVAMLPGHWSGCGKIGKCDLTIRIDQARKASVQITCQQSSADPALFLLLWYFTTVFVCFSCSDFFSISLLSACTCGSLNSIFTTLELHYI